jgi:hypothetical protein
MVRRKIREKRVERFRSKVHARPRLLSKYESRELIPILEILHMNQFDEGFKRPLRKYLLVVCVSIMEEFLIRLLAETIDKKNVNISVFGSDKTKSFSPGKYSKGQHIASHYYFGTPDVIDNAFSNLLKTNSKFNSLNMNFLESVKKADWYDPFRNYKRYRTKSLYKNWDNFIALFEKRNQLIHGMSQIRLTNSQIASFCDNILTFLDIAIALCLMDESVFEILGSDTQINSGRKANSLAEASFDP